MDNETLIEAIGQIHISVDDLQRCVAFYRDVLEMRLLLEVDEPPMAFFQCGEVRLYLARPTSPEFRSNPLIYFRVADIHAACSALEGRGVVIDNPPRVVNRTDDYEMWIAGFRDVEDNHVMLMSEVIS